MDIEVDFGGIGRINLGLGTTIGFSKEFQLEVEVVFLLCLDVQFGVADIRILVDCKNLCSQLAICCKGLEFG